MGSDNFGKKEALFRPDVLVWLGMCDKDLRWTEMFWTTLQATACNIGLAAWTCGRLWARQTFSKKGLGWYRIRGVLQDRYCRSDQKLLHVNINAEWCRLQCQTGDMRNCRFAHSVEKKMKDMRQHVGRTLGGGRTFRPSWIPHCLLESFQVTKSVCVF